MKKTNIKTIKIAFTGGGTGGHIYPGLAIVSELRNLAKKHKQEISIIWIGSSQGMDSQIASPFVEKFYGIPSGKLRRYFSVKNFFDVFKIIGGCISSFFILLKNKPDVLFSKGGFVSVPPCLSARILHIPIYTHECDFTPGLATKINSRSAKKVLLSYPETKDFLRPSAKVNSVVTGNPVRPEFYKANVKAGLKFLKITKKTKPVLLVMGGSLGAKQINDLVNENLEWLCSNFIVVHQTGIKNQTEDNNNLPTKLKANYKSYPFIYAEMPSVIASCDIVLSRAGANSLWECAVLNKPMVLIPLAGSGTRGDQIDNADFFEKKGAAIVLKGNNVNSKSLQSGLTRISKQAKNFSDACKKMISDKRPSEVIAEMIYAEATGEN